MKIAVTGGAGYVGSKLVPLLIKKRHEVTVLDTFWYGDKLESHSKLRKIRGDIGNKADIDKTFRGQDVVIHLACISNDPSFDLNPDLGRSINLTAFKNILHGLRDHKIKQFIYASSSSVYGVSDSPKVTEETPCEPLTDYSKYKLACEVDLKNYYQQWDGIWTILRPATVCGHSPRMRFDLVVNALTISALVKRNISVHGGDQFRPNIHINDMVRAYDFVLNSEPSKINKKTFNVGSIDYNLSDLGRKVKDALGDNEIVIYTEPMKDPRSYRINSDLIYDAGFVPDYTIAGAVNAIKTAYDFKQYREPLTNPDYYNILRMKELKL